MNATMRITTLGLVLGIATSALALDKAELDNRIRKLTAKFEAMQQKPDRCIPAETLRKAQGIILLDRTKAGLVFAYYEQALTMSEILFGKKVKPTETASALAARLDEFSKPPKK